MLKAVTYARVSGDDRGRDGRNLAGQLDLCRQYALERGWQVVAELAEDDRGASGASFELPQLNRIREMAQAGDFDVLVVREIDRLSRKLAKQLVVEEELNRLGIEISYVLAEYADSPEGRLNKHIRATIAEYEREKINERMIRGRRLKVKAGHVLVHSSAPYGYELYIDENGKNSLIINEPEARIVRMIYNWYVNGDDCGKKLTMKAITRKLTELHVPTRLDTVKGKGGFKKKDWGEWSRATVGKILGNEVYIGNWYYGKEGHDQSEWLAVRVPAIIDKDVWEIARKMRVMNKQKTRENRKHKYLLVGHIRCGKCSCGIYGHPNLWRSKNARGLNFYYRCAGVDGSRVRVWCDLPQFRVDQVDEAVWGWIERFLSNPELLQQGLLDYQTDKEKESHNYLERLSVIDDLLEENHAQLKRLLELYLTGEFSKDMLIDHKKRLENTIDALEKERGSLKAHMEAQTVTDAQIQSIQEFAKEVSEGMKIASMDFDTRRNIIELLDVQVVLTLEDAEKCVNIRCVMGSDKSELFTLSHGYILDGSVGWLDYHHW
jgi:site-specific DNA recombinase